MFTNISEINEINGQIYVGNCIDAISLIRLGQTYIGNLCMVPSSFKAKILYSILPWSVQRLMSASLLVVEMVLLMFGHLRLLRRQGQVPRSSGRTARQRVSSCWPTSNRSRLTFGAELELVRVGGVGGISRMIDVGAVRLDGVGVC